MNFLGIFKADYNKEGKGIGKTDSPRNGFVRFFQTLWEKLFYMVLLNLLYVFACLPIITIGPATAAMSYITRNYALGKPVFFWSDFTSKCKEHLKQGIAVFLIDAVLVAVLYFSVTMWTSMNVPDMLRVIALIFCFWVAYIVLCANFYIFPMMASFQLTLKQLIKNSVILSMCKLGRNLAMIILQAAIALLVYFLFPLSVPMVLLLVFSVSALATNFIVFPVFEKHILVQDEPSDKDETEPIFRDMH